MKKSYRVLLVTLPIALAACSDKKSSPPPPSDNSVNVFVNTFDGEIAIRTMAEQLTGDFIGISFRATENSAVQGTASIGAQGVLARIAGSHSEAGYEQPFQAEDGTMPLTANLTIAGVVDAAAGTFTATGSGADGGGGPITVSLSGSFRQLGSNQVASTDVSINSNGTQLRAKGQLAGRDQVAPPSTVALPPLITPPLRIPQGVTVRFAPTGTAAVANPDLAETGDIVNFTLPGYQAPGFDGFSNISSGDWVFAFDGTLFTVTVPLDAPITTGYQIRDRSTGVPRSATFEVVACPLQEFTAANFIGDPVWADVEFFDTLTAIHGAAGEAGVKVFVTNSFRTANQTLQGVVVPPADRSNHLAGHGIDMNVQYLNASGAPQLCNSACLSGSSPPAAVTDFLQRCRAAGVRYGGDFSTPDPVHFDDALNQNATAYDVRYGIIQQCARNKGF